MQAYRLHTAFTLHLECAPFEDTFRRCHWWIMHLTWLETGYTLYPAGSCKSRLLWDSNIVFAIIHPLHLKIGKDLRSSWIFLNVLVVNWLKYANSLKLPQSKRLQENICMLYIVYCSVQSVSPYGKLPQQIGVEQCEIFAWIKLSKLFPSWRPISSSPSPSLSLSLSC